MSGMMVNYICGQISPDSSEYAIVFDNQMINDI